MATPVTDGYEQVTTANAERLAEVLKQLDQAEVDSIVRARSALLAFLRRPDNEPDLDTPIDAVADETGIGAEQVHLALASLLADHSVAFTDDYILKVVEPDSGPTPVEA